MPRRPSALELAFANYWKLLAKDLPKYETELRFHPPRLWKIDFAWPEQQVAVELEGGVWTGGGHTTGKGFTANVEKYNQLTLNGWRLLRFTSNQLEDDPKGCIDMVRQLLKSAPRPKPRSAV